MGPDGAIFMDKVCRGDAAAALLLTDTHGQPGSTREMSHDYTSNMSHYAKKRGLDEKTW